MVSDNTPVLIGFGQVVLRKIDSVEQVQSPVDITVSAVKEAIKDVGCEGLSEHIDALAMVRGFIDSTTVLKQPFGSSNKPPLSVANRLGIKPARLVYGSVGGQSPQRFVNEFAEAIYRGDSKCVVICGAEATGIMKQGLRNTWPINWSEELSDDIEDRGITALMSNYERAHHITYPPQVYALLENAWRAKHNMSVQAHQQLMAKLFAGFSEVAASNPYAQFPVARDTAFLAQASAENYPVNIPYNKWFVAQDAVNQGAAVVMTSVGAARELNIPEDKWVYLHGYADADDVLVSKRPDLSASAAIKASAQVAFSMAGKTVEDMDLFDIYSCFPIAVLAACDAMGIDWESKSALTVTGGLPFFGGAGNNYSLHAIAQICSELRDRPGDFGVVSANGGYLSKQSVGIYSTQPTPQWQPNTESAQALVDAQASVALNKIFSGDGVIETYSLVYAKGKPVLAFMVGRDPASNQRFLAKAAEGDTATLDALQQAEPIGREVTVLAEATGCTFKFK